MTMATDLLLSAVTLFLGGRLIERARRLRRSSLWFWSGVFIASSIAALAGGTLHGMKPYLGEASQVVLWKSAVYAVGLASFFMFSGTIMDSTSRPARQWLLVLALVKFLLFSLWMIAHNDFLFVICDYGGSMIGVLFLQLYRITLRREKDRLFIIAGVLLSLAAAAIQQSNIAIYASFNHNALYHIAQAGAFYLFYRGLIRA